MQATAFSIKPPSKDFPWLMHQTILPLDFIKGLKDVLGQQWFDGAKWFVNQWVKDRL